jgi:Zn finger protein HypA/HybF involved in hydrogenase expression/predicted GIY-YIG superfamily endonuclease
MLGKSTFKCKLESCGHIWESTADNVTRGKGCPKCAKNTACSLEELVAKLKPRNITVVDYSGLMSSMAKFKCDLDGTEWEANVTSVVTSGRGCPNCGRMQTRVTEAEAKAKLLSYDIELIAKGNLVEDKATFRCLKDGYEWSTDLKQVLYGQTGCPKCAGVAKVTEAEAIARLEGREIELISYAGTTAGNSRFKCKVDGHQWSTTLSSIVTNGQGCPVCAKSGFKPDQPAFFYIYRLSTAGCEYLGFGITNNLRRRKAEHTGSIRSANAEGRLHSQFEMLGQTAQELEASLKKTLPICNTGIEGFIREAVLYSPEMLEYIESRASACLGT